MSAVYDPGCSGKIAYDNAKDAVRVLSRMKKRRADGRALGHYRCPCCSQWHVGSARKS